MKQSQYGDNHMQSIELNLKFDSFNELSAFLSRGQASEVHTLTSVSVPLQTIAAPEPAPIPTHYAPAPAQYAAPAPAPAQVVAATPAPAAAGVTISDLSSKMAARLQGSDGRPRADPLKLRELMGQYQNNGRPVTRVHDLAPTDYEAFAFALDNL